MDTLANRSVRVHPMRRRRDLALQRVPAGAGLVEHAHRAGASRSSLRTSRRTAVGALASCHVTGALPVPTTIATNRDGRELRRLLLQFRDGRRRVAAPGRGHDFQPVLGFACFLQCAGPESQQVPPSDGGVSLRVVRPDCSSCT